MSYEDLGYMFSKPLSIFHPSMHRFAEAYSESYRNYDPFGFKRMINSQQSAQAQIAYENYLKGGNYRAYDDWQKNVGSKGRTIRYPEFSYPGQIYRSDTAIARAGFDYSTASANYYGNFPYRLAGLYGIGGRMSRYL